MHNIVSVGSDILCTQRNAMLSAFILYFDHKNQNNYRKIDAIKIYVLFSQSVSLIVRAYQLETDSSSHGNFNFVNFAAVGLIFMIKI